LIEEVVLAIASRSFASLFWSISDGAMLCLSILVRLMRLCFENSQLICYRLLR
jgi:hypothetical protein